MKTSGVTISSSSRWNSPSESWTRPEGLELFAEVLLQRQPVADVGAVDVLELAQAGDQFFFELALGRKS